MADCTSKAKANAPQHEGRVVIMTGPSTIQSIAPPIEKITDVTVVAAKYDKYFDDIQYYSS